MPLSYFDSLRSASKFNTRHNKNGSNKLQRLNKTHYPLNCQRDGNKNGVCLLKMQQILQEAKYL